MRGQIIDHGPREATASVSDRSLWRFAGDFSDAGNAADNDVLTVATSSATPTSHLQIDLGKPCVFNLIVIDHGPDYEQAFPGKLVVQTSYDGRDWNDEPAVAGTRRITYILLSGPRLARYIRLQTQVRGDSPWTVAEVYVQ